MKQNEKSGTKITRKSASLVVGVLVLFRAHTHKELSRFTLARERKERDLTAGVVLFVLFIRERERERECNKSAKRITYTKVPQRRRRSAKKMPKSEKKTKDDDDDVVVENKTGNPVSSKEEAMRIIGEKEEDKNAVMSLFSDVNPNDPLRPIFAPLGKQNEKKGEKAMYRKVNVPSHRLSPLKEHWMALYTPVTKQMKIDMRMNLKLKKVELKTTDQTEDESALQKSADFIQAFVLGFEIQDAVALLRLDDLYLECFEVKDVKQTLRGEHMSRGIGRLAGKSGKTKYTIENATRTRIVIADQHIRILGSFQNIKVARNALCALIMGSPPGKVYSRLRTVTARLAERF